MRYLLSIGFHRQYTRTFLNLRTRAMSATPPPEPTSGPVPGVADPVTKSAGALSMINSILDDTCDMI